MISLVICLATLLIVSHAAKIPSADDIEDYNDPVLREVFASSRKNRPTGGDVEQLPQLTRNWSSTQTVTSEYPVKSASVPSISTYRPVQQPVYSSYQQPPSLSQSYNPQPADLGTLAAQGAQTFVQGAQEVGRVFGIDSSAYNSGGYEFPLGGGFFGR